MAARRDAGADDAATAERFRCAMCWGTLRRAVVPWTCAHRVCAACYRDRDDGRACARCGRGFGGRATRGRAMDDDLDDAIARALGGRETWRFDARDADEDARALGVLKSAFGYAESRAFGGGGGAAATTTAAAAAAATTTADGGQTSEGASMPRKMVEEVYHVRFRAWGGRDVALGCRHASAPGSATVRALARTVEKWSAKRVVAMRDVSGVERSMDESVEAYFASSRELGRPYVAWFETA